MLSAIPRMRLNEGMYEAPKYVTRKDMRGQAMGDMVGSLAITGIYFKAGGVLLCVAYSKFGIQRAILNNHSVIGYI